MTPDFQFGCPTCKDEALPARMLSIDEQTHTARAQFDVDQREVALDLLADVHVGDFVLVHLDTAIAKLDPSDVLEH